MKQQVHKQHEQHHQDGDAHDHHPKRCSGAGAHDTHARAAADHRSPLENRVGRVLDRHRIRRRNRSDFFDRIGFPGQHRLVHEEIVRLQHHGIGRDEIARSQQDDVARNHVTGGDLDPDAIAQDGGPQRHRIAQSLGRRVGPVLLDEVQRHAHQHQTGDDEEVGQFAARRRDGAGKQQNEYQRVAKTRKVLEHQRAIAFRRDLIRARFKQAALGLVGSEPCCKRRRVARARCLALQPPGLRGRCVGHAC